MVTLDVLSTSGRLLATYMYISSLSTAQSSYTFVLMNLILKKHVLALCFVCGVWPIYMYMVPYFFFFTN